MREPFERDGWDVLVVGAGPTGLALAAQLQAHGSSVLVVDQSRDRVRESRALGVQARTLEVLRPFGLSHELVRRGNPAVTLQLHAGARTVGTRLFDIGVDDTEFPFLLFVSQAETEAVLGDHLASVGVPVQRDTRLRHLGRTADGCTATLRCADGSLAEVRSRYVVGCDGAHSTVREQAGIAFVGGRYPQTFLLADLAIDGLEAGAVHAFLTDSGPFLCFPLDRPAPWRIITVRPDRGSATSGTSEPMRSSAAGRGGEPGDTPVASTPVGLAELQRLADRATGRSVRLHEPVWATAFHLHHRHAAHYRSGRVFLAGDAAHIHSPAGAQGMNTGIQDAINLGWKLALTCRGVATESLLASYDAERRPVGEFVLRFTDRAFTAATSEAAVPRLVRSHVVPRALPVALRFRAGRALAFRTVSQLRIAYRSGPAIEPPPRRPPRGLSRPGPRAGDRLPDAEVQVDGTRTRLHEVVAAPRFHLLVTGSRAAWRESGLLDLGDVHRDLLTVHWLGRDPRPGSVHDASGEAHRRLGLDGAEALLVRPDGHLACRATVADDAVRRYLSRVVLTSSSRSR